MGEGTTPAWASSRICRCCPQGPCRSALREGSGLDGTWAAPAMRLRGLLSPGYWDPQKVRDAASDALPAHCAWLPASTLPALPRPLSPAPRPRCPHGGPGARSGWPVGMTPSGSREAQAWPRSRGPGLGPASPSHEWQPWASCLPSPGLSFPLPGGETQPTWLLAVVQEARTKCGARARPGFLRMATGQLTTEATGPGSCRPPRLQRP